MNQILVVALLILLMSGTALAEQVEEWPFGQRNEIPDDIEGVRYDFEEGSNCGDFKDQYPEVSTFLTVLTGNVPLGYGPNYPSYGRVGGSMCGKTRCYMNIYPNSRYENWTYVVNGMVGFSPKTCCEADPSICWTGECYPGTDARIQFKEGTHYVSFLASTGGNLYVRLYDMKGSQYNLVHYEKITGNTDRVNGEPSNFTQFSIHLPNTDIARMDIRGIFNGWHGDDLIIGGEPGYLPTRPVNYTYVAQRAQELWGVDYLEYGLGHDYVIMDYMDPWQFKDSALEEYWNPETKQFELGEGISNPGLIVWAYNYDAMELADTRFVKWSTVDGMAKHDFTVPVDPGDIQPGDVYFMDRDFDSKNTPDEVGMVVEETNGMNLITACPDSNKVVYSKSSIVESSPAYLGYFRLPGVIKGGHNPIPKGH